MKIAQGIKMTYVNQRTREIEIEEYSSILRAAKHYQISSVNLKKIIDHPEQCTERILKKLPVDCRFEYVDVDFPKRRRNQRDQPLWHCDICDKDMLLGSKANHLLSIRHREIMLGIRDA